MDAVVRSQTARADVGRRFLAGVVSGLVLAAALVFVGAPPLVVTFGLAFGVGYVFVFSPSGGAVLDHAFGGAAAAIPAWVLVSVTLFPVVEGAGPAWTAAGMGAVLPDLVAWSVGGAGCGTVASVVCPHLVGDPVEAERDERAPPETRIVIVGGGFAGIAAAKRFEERFGPDPTVELVLLSETNSLLFTPMLAEVAGGSLEPTQIMSPYRSTLRRTKVIGATAVDADLDAKRVYVPAADGDHARGGGKPGKANADDETGRESVATPSGDMEHDREDIEYDHLVLATGATTNYFGMEDVRSFAFEFKTLDDATALRNHVIQCFERAERTDDPQRRRELLTFVVTGGGFAGTELAGALNDFIHELLSFYPYLSPDEVGVVLVHSGDRIMPALTESLSAYALERLEERGVDVRLGTRVAGADADERAVLFEDGDRVQTETLVWTAGVRPGSFVRELDVPHAGPGAVEADATFAVSSRDDVWAVGDCAVVEDPETGEYHPTTAQYATRAGTHLADNVHAVVTGGEPRPFTYHSKGKLAVIGHNSAVAEVAGRQFSGLFAWLLWRAIYLSKLPGTDRKIRVFINWTVELLFPRDIVMTTADREGVNR